MSKLLSIVIPCYNSSETIISYLKSQSVQSNSLNIEFIVIDDCSTDDSRNELISFAKETKLDVVLVFNESNSGPGFSRNEGINKSTGEYVTFLDSDDRFDDSFFDMVFPLLKRNYDCIMFDYKIINGKRSYTSNIMTNGDNNNMPSASSVLVYSKGMTCGKIYKRKVLIESSARFLCIRRNEDLPFTKVAISNCSSFFHICAPLYLYFQNQSSLMHDVTLLDIKNAQLAFKTIDDMLNDSFSCEKEAIFMLEYVYSTGLSSLETMKRHEWKEYIGAAKTSPLFNTKNFYIKGYSLRVRLLIFLISHRLFLLTKMVYFVQKKIKKMRGM